MKLFALVALIGATNAAACTGLESVTVFTEKECKTAPETAVADEDLAKIVTAMNALFDDTCVGGLEADGTTEVVGGMNFVCSDTGSKQTVYESKECKTACSAFTEDPCKTALTAANIPAEADLLDLKDDSCVPWTDSKFYKLKFKGAAADATATGSSSLALGVGLGLVAATLY